MTIDTAKAVLTKFKNLKRQLKNKKEQLTFDMGE